MAEVSTWKDRVRQELKDLEDRASKLHAFIYSPPRKQLAEEMQDLLKLQYQLMTRYADVLRARIELMDD